METKKDGSPKKEKESNHFEANGRTYSADSGFVSPETICRPKLTGSRRNSPANENQPFSSFRIEDARDACRLSEVCTHV